MRIAFIVLAHQKPEQVQRLARRLSLDYSCIFIHLDRGSPKHTLAAMQKELSGLVRLEWLPQFYSPWGSWGLVQASLAGLEKAYQAGCDYALLLSGQDYPIRPPSRLVDFLEKNNGHSFLQYHRLPSETWPPDGSNRYTRWHFNLGWRNSSARKLTNRALNRVFNTFFPNRTLPEGLAPFGGWQWWCLHRSAIQYVLEFTRTHPNVVAFFKRVRIPDEMYFHTVLLNSNLSASVQNRPFTYADWQGPPFPRILTQSDLQKLKNSNHFFARKFDPSVDAAVLDSIDHELLQSCE